VCISRTPFQLTKSPTSIEKHAANAYARSARVDGRSRYVDIEGDYHSQLVSTGPDWKSSCLHIPLGIHIRFCSHSSAAGRQLHGEIAEIEDAAGADHEPHSLQSRSDMRARARGARGMLPMRRAIAGRDRAAYPKPTDVGFTAVPMALDANGFGRIDDPSVWNAHLTERPRSVRADLEV